MNEWLKQELETAKAELFRPYHNMEVCEHCRYWTGYTDAITNALHELTGMDNN